MKTENLIKDKSRMLFNQYGVMNITLRRVADELGKSYGNVRYHFATKEVLLTSLFSDMNDDFFGLPSTYETKNNLELILMLPKLTFDIELKYLFFTIDYIELKRNYPEFFKKVMSTFERRKEKWMVIMKSLREEKFIDNKYGDEDLNYIMFLSGSVRSAYFQNTDSKKINKTIYVKTVNSLIRPYLTKRGLQVYEDLKLES